MAAEFFKKVVGHEGAKSQLSRMMDRSNTPHALLFSGPESVGKRKLAWALASSLLTKKDPSSDTEKSRLLAAGNHPDLHWLLRAEEKKDITVEGVREMCSAMRLAPYYGTCKISIINNAHEMNIAACNALLMTLEEPSNNSYLILVTHAAQRLPATILSRCQVVHFGELHDSELETILGQVLSGSDQSARAKLLQLCSGSLAPLGLEPFVNPKTLELTHSKDLQEHLAELVSRSARLTKEFADFFEQAGQGALSACGAASFASGLSSDSDALALNWRLLNQALRRELRSSTKERLGYWAVLLERSLAAERLTFERNANAALQLTSLFLDAAD